MLAIVAVISIHLGGVGGASVLTAPGWVAEVARRGRVDAAEGRWAARGGAWPRHPIETQDKKC